VYAIAELLGASAEGQDRFMALVHTDKASQPNARSLRQTR
jgi:hypothetical protein